MGTRIKNALPLIISAAVLVAVVLSCLLLYRHDNKYTHPGPQAGQGILMLDEGLPEDTPVTFLVKGWAYYHGRLLSPRNFAENSPIPDEYLFIGQYGGFDRNDVSASPHGNATYRLRIRLPEESRQYMLELPEIFSAYRLYVNGREIAGMGIPEPEAYQPATRNRTVVFEASGSADILIAVSDYSHFYSGMVYPPAFGQPEAVSGLLTERFMFRSLLCAAAGVIGLLAILIGLLSRRQTPVWYGLLCLLFIGYAGYPLWRSFTYWYGPLYSLENLSFCLILLIALLIQRPLQGKVWKRSRGIPFLCFGGFMAVFTVIVHALLPSGNLRMMAAYSVLISLYQWATAAFLTVSSLGAASRGSVGAWSVLCGILALDAALIMDRLLPLFEPIVSGWFVELAAFALILCIGLAIGGNVAAQYRQSAILSERARGAEQLLRMQQTYHSELMRQAEKTRIVRHDLRHHFTVMKGMLDNRQYNELQAYLEQYGGGIPSDGPGRYCEHHVANVIADYYAQVAKAGGIELTLQLDIRHNAFLSHIELGSIISNLLENATEACLRLPENSEPWISIHATGDASAFALHMENRAGGIQQANGRFFSTKREEREGYGLHSVQTIVDRYHGESEFRYNTERGIFVSTVLLTADGINGKVKTYANSW